VRRGWPGRPVATWSCQSSDDGKRLAVPRERRIWYGKWVYPTWYHLPDWPVFMNFDEKADLPEADGPIGGGRLQRRVGHPHQWRSAAEIQQWFVDSLARITDSPPEEIDVNAPFESFGLDSVTAVGLTGELEEWLGCTVDPMAVYDYPTIQALAGHLAELSAAKESSS